MPVLNEAEQIVATLAPLQTARKQGQIELILADGGSSDATCELAVALVDRIVSSKPGRGVQQDSGANVARGEWLLFLHADTRLPERWQERILTAVQGRTADWGRFDLCLDGEALMFRLIERMITLRSRLSGIATGDQAIFVRRESYTAVGGFEPLPLMEDLRLSARLKQRSRPLCISDPVLTSTRRWQKHGIWRTIILMWWLRYRHWRGQSPASLARQYVRHR